MPTASRRLKRRLWSIYTNGQAIAIPSASRRFAVAISQLRDRANPRTNLRRRGATAASGPVVGDTWRSPPDDFAETVVDNRAARVARHPPAHGLGVGVELCLLLTCATCEGRRRRSGRRCLQFAAGRGAAPQLPPAHPLRRRGRMLPCRRRRRRVVYVDPSAAAPSGAARSLPGYAHPVWSFCPVYTSLLPPRRRHRRRPRLRQRVDARRQAGSFPGAHVRHLLLVLLEERERLEELLLAAARLGPQLVVVRCEHRVPRVGGVRARRLGLAAAARLLEVPPDGFRALERLARPRKLGLGRGARRRGPCVARHRACAPWCAFSTARSCWTSFATRRCSVALGSAACRPSGRAAAARRAGRDDLARAAMAVFDPGPRVDRVTLMARSAPGFSAFI